MEITSDHSKNKSEIELEKGDAKLKLLKKKLKVMRTALKDENSARISTEKEL